MERWYSLTFDGNVGLNYGCERIPGPVVKDPRVCRLQGSRETPPIPWEPRIDNGYPNVFYDRLHGEYRCYYTSFLRDDATALYTEEERQNREYDIWNPQYRPRIAGILMATSRDGITWERPELGVCEWEGSKQNNILLADAHGASVFLDEHETDPARRYKMMVRHDAHETMAVAFSSDGIHFTEPIDWPENSPAGDTHNFAYWDETIGRYVLITRTWSQGRLRLAARCESDDFIHWSRPVEVFRGDGPADQWYSMVTFRRHGMQYALASFYHDGDRSSPDYDCVDCELLTSYDGWHWDRVAPYMPIIPRGGAGEPDRCCIYPSAPVEENGTYRIYYFGGDGCHTGHRHSTLLCASVDPDRLAGYRPREEGMVGTRPMAFCGDRVIIAADAEANGEIRAAVCPHIYWHSPVVPLEGYGFDDCAVECLGGGRYAVSFTGRGLAALDRPYVLVFRLRGAVLYGYGGEVEVH